MPQTIGLDYVVYDNTILQWITAAGITLVAAVVLRLGVALLIRRIRALARWTENDVDDLLVDLLSRTRGMFILLVALWVGSRWLELGARAEDLLEAVLVIGLLLQFGYWGSALIHFALDRYRRRQAEVDPGGATAVGALHFIAQSILWTILVLTGLSNLGVDITAFIASLGLGGIAIALALQNVLSDLFASLSIILDKPFVIGDFIIVGDFMGTVEHVGLKTTRVRSLSGEQLIFSNSDLLNSRIRNYKRMDERRAVFSVGVTYDTPSSLLKRVPEIIRSAVEDQENTRFDRSHFSGFGDSSLDFETVYYMLVPDFNSYMDTQQAINLAVYDAFEREGLEFAFPTRTLHLVGADAAENGSPVEAAAAGGHPGNRGTISTSTRPGAGEGELG